MKISAWLKILAAVAVIVFAIWYLENERVECEKVGGEFHAGKPSICIKPGSEIKTP